jgi:hypothetical protein
MKTVTQLKIAILRTELILVRIPKNIDDTYLRESITDGVDSEPYVTALKIRTAYDKAKAERLRIHAEILTLQKQELAELTAPCDLE